MQGAVVPPGILMFLFILPRLVVQTTLKPVYLPQSPFPEPGGLPYLQLLIPLGGGEACGRPGSSRILETQIHWSLAPLLKSNGVYSALVMGSPSFFLFLLPEFQTLGYRSLMQRTLSKLDLYPILGATQFLPIRNAR